MEKLRKFFTEKFIKFSWRRIWLSLLAVFVIVGIFLAGLTVYAQTYKDKVLPGIYIGDVPVGGMSEAELRQYFETMNDKLASEGINIIYQTDEKEDRFTIYPVLAAEGSAIELVKMDTEQEIKELLSYGKANGFLSKLYNTVRSRLQSRRLSLQHVSVNQERILAEIRTMLTPYEKEPRDAAVKVISVSPLNYNITDSSAGYGFDYASAPGEILRQWSALKMPTVKMTQKAKEPKVLEADVKSIENRLAAVFDDGPIILEYTDPHTQRNYFWTLTVDNLIDLLEAQKTEIDGFGFGLNRKSLVKYLEDKVASRINKEPRDAKFKTGEDGKVVEFQGSRPGIGLNVEESYQMINEAFLQRTWHDEGVAKTIQVAAEQVEPNIKTGEVNDLGITEVLGTGISDFAGSPRNRILNIKNASAKLNGVLIKPDEEFSAIKYTRPFTLEGGYYPELVIKGDEVKPEIGGGLCQIGTTLFRMAMNSGMPITMRQNHSLVVGYYKDPVNGNPGTDATVYDPIPDLRFLNDTGHYILLQTYVDEDNKELYYTLWGTSDGRKGYYSHPEVSQWIGFGKTVEKETTKLAPGERKCQHAYWGANTAFTYTRELPDGTKEDRVFTSHYRPLPEICLVGVEEKTETVCPITETGVPAEGCAAVDEGAASAPAEEAAAPAADAAVE